MLQVTHRRRAPALIVVHNPGEEYVARETLEQRHCFHFKGNVENPQMESVCSEQARSATLLYLVIALLKLIYCELRQKTSSQQQTSRSQGGKKIAEFQTVIKGCWRQHFNSQMYQALESLSGEAVERVLLQSQRQSTKKCTLSRNFALASVGYQTTGSWFSRQWKQASCGRGKPIPHKKPGLRVGSGTARRDEDPPYYSERDIGDAGVMLSTHQLLSPHALPMLT